MANSRTNSTVAPSQSPPSGNLIVTIFVINGVFIGLCLLGLFILRWLQVKEFIWFPPSSDDNRGESRSEPNRAGGRNPTQAGEHSASNDSKKGRNNTLDSDDPEEVLRPNGQPIHLQVLDADNDNDQTAHDLEQFRFDVVDTHSPGRNETQLAQS